MQTTKPRTFIATLRPFASRALYAFFAFLGLTWILLLILWPRSYWTYDQVSLIRHKAYHITSTQGMLYFECDTLFFYYSYNRATQITTVSARFSEEWRFRYTYASVQYWPTSNWFFLLAPSPYLGGKFALAPHHQSGNTGEYRNGYAIPHFLLLIALSPFAFLAIKVIRSIVYAFRSRKKNQPHLRGLCPSCGYNLTGNPSAPACPECGKPALAPNLKIQT